MSLINKAKEIYYKKLKDYGYSWKEMRMPSIADQILIKTKRILYMINGKDMNIKDDIKTELIGIWNYSIIALMIIDNNKEYNKYIPKESTTSKETLEVVINKVIYNMNKVKDLYKVDKKSKLYKYYFYSNIKFLSAFIE